MAVKSEKSKTGNKPNRKAPKAAPAKGAKAKTPKQRPTPAPSLASQPGMGAIPYDGGVAFRVWAPNAEGVYVGGSFSEWEGDRYPLFPEGNGYWSTDVPGAKIGDHYKFRILNGEMDLWRIDPYAREVTNSVGDGIISDNSFEWDNDQHYTPPWNEMYIYEMHVGTFTHPDGRRGTFDSAIEKIAYLRDLGVNVVQVMPPAEFPGGISWGYNPCFIYAVESDYGGPQAFKRFVRACHDNGLAVILDVVYNHFGPSDLDLWQFDGWSENGMGGIYFYNDWRANTPWGDSRPNYGRPEVRQYIRDNVMMWLEDFHLDGLRWDATAHIRNVKGNNNAGDDLPDGWSLLQGINSEVRGKMPWVLMIAEDLQTSTAITAPTEAGGAGFGAQWDAAFVHPVRSALITQDDPARDMNAVAGAITHRYGENAFARVVYTESHDEVANGKSRVPEEIWPGNAGSWPAKKRATLGSAVMFTAPGIPMIFQGQEFLEDKWFDDTRPVDWDKAERYGGILQLHRDLARLRRNFDGNTKGLSGANVAVTHVNNDAKVIVYRRWMEGGPGDTCVVIANFCGTPIENYTIGLPGEGTWQVRFNSDAGHYDSEFSNYPTQAVNAETGEYDGQPFHGQIGVGPYSLVVLSQ